ncbi:MAG: twin-arginine translocase subunit TatC [Bacteroidales bacterium]|nr:twin-arginine translocase subunit TatC [Bacteroidales bacterium]
MSLKKESNTQQEMTFWEHLDELRKVLFRSAILIVVLMVVIFSAKDFIFDRIVFAPISSDFPLYRMVDKLLAAMGMPGLDPFKLELINIELSAQFFIHISTTFYFALVLATPFVLYQLWLFIKPALYENEERLVMGAFSFAAILFFIGVLVGYYLIFPLTLRFLGTYQVSSDVANQISLQSYISMFTWMILIMGVVFEMPSLAAILSRLGVLTRSFLKKYRRHAFVVLLILAAFITPSGDPFTLMAVGLPLYALYELSIFVCRDINK